MDPIQTMPSLDALTQKAYSRKEWLAYYKNIWTRNIAATSIDILTDTWLKAEDAEQVVPSDENPNRGETVKDRLEKRKDRMVTAKRLMKALEELSAMSDEEFAEKMLSDAALTPAADTAEEEVVVGEVSTETQPQEGAIVEVATPAATETVVAEKTNVDENTNTTEEGK